jgi:hypothetical protein
LEHGNAMAYLTAFFDNEDVQFAASIKVRSTYVIASCCWLRESSEILGLLIRGEPNL